MNYEVAIKPYLKGAENVTVVAIKMENNGRYSYEQCELPGDHTQDNEATLVQAVLDHIRTELDPTSGNRPLWKNHPCGRFKCRSRQDNRLWD